MESVYNETIMALTIEGRKPDRRWKWPVLMNAAVIPPFPDACKKWGAAGIGRIWMLRSGEFEIRWY
jgi:hypothetical protein